MILEAVNLKKSFQQAETKIAVLSKLNLSIEPGETVAILGQSGSGKSTLLTLLAGLDLPDEGTLSVLGVDLATLSEEQLTDFRGKNLGIVFQQFHLMSTLTALENISLPLEIQGAADPILKARAALKSVGLAHREAHHPHQLSGGECQRVAIARALVTRPKVLLADEPSGNLDTETGNEVMNLLFNLVTENQMTLILVTHNEALAKRCSRQLVLTQGALRDIGP